WRMENVPNPANDFKANKRRQHEDEESVHQIYSPATSEKTLPRRVNNRARIHSCRLSFVIPSGFSREEPAFASAPGNLRVPSPRLAALTPAERKIPAHGRSPLPRRASQECRE